MLSVPQLTSQQEIFPAPSNSITCYKEVFECFVDPNEEALISCKVQAIKADKIHSAFNIDAI